MHLVKSHCVGLMLLAGCALHEGDLEPPPDVVSCEAAYQPHIHRPRPLDVLLVVDATPEMVPYRDQWIAELERIFDTVGMRDYRVAVVSSDPATGAAWETAPGIAGCSPPAGDFLDVDPAPWFTCADSPWDICPRPNFDGALSAAVPCIAALPADAAAPRQPLAAMVRALEDEDFVRHEAAQIVVILSAGDDSSPGAVADYLARLPDTLFGVAVIAPPTAVRLRELPGPSAVALDGPDWSSALGVIEGPGMTLDYSCLWELPAGTPICVVTDPEGAAIPPCSMATPTRPAPDTLLPCWWVGPVSYEALDCHWEPNVEGVEYPVFRCEADCSD